MKNELKLLSLVFGGTSVLVSVDAAKAAVMIPVKCDGMQVGTINVDTTTAIIDGQVRPGVKGGFTTTPMFPTLADAAAKCGEDHFNWYQIVKKDNMPPNDADGNPLTPPYDDPPPGGYDFQWADDLPWYWDEGPDPDPLPDNFEDGLNLDDHTFVNFLNYEDFPGGADGTMVSFWTKLASINADGSLHRLYGGFSWDYVDPIGPTGPSIQNLRAKTPEPSSILSLIALGSFGLVAVKQRA